MREKKYNFKGPIERIEYDEKKAVTVKVNGKQFDISSGWKFNEKMSLGDSLVKEEGSITYKLIKQKTGEVIFSNE